MTDDICTVPMQRPYHRERDLHAQEPYEPGTAFGEGRDLDTLQMAARAFVLFFVMLVLVHVAGMRAFGRKHSFGTIIVITLAR